MPGTVGANLQSLRDLHKTFTTSAQEASHIKTSVSKDLDNAVWTGKFSTDFRTAWQDYQKNLVNLENALNAAADDVKANHNNIAAATGEPERI
jgi:uncharacterized protein YukE